MADFETLSDIESIKNAAITEYLRHLATGQNASTVRAFLMDGFSGCDTPAKVLAQVNTWTGTQINGTSGAKDLAMAQVKNAAQSTYTYATTHMHDKNDIDGDHNLNEQVLISTNNAVLKNRADDYAAKAVAWSEGQAEADYAAKAAAWAQGVAAAKAKLGVIPELPNNSHIKDAAATTSTSTSAGPTSIVTPPSNTIMVDNPANTIRLVRGSGPDLGDSQLEGNGVAVFQITDEGIKLHITGEMAEQLKAAGRWHEPTLVDQDVLDGTATSGTLASIDGGIAPLVVPATVTLSSDDRIAQVISNPDLGWNIKAKVIQEIQAGNQDSNKHLINWFNEGKPESEAAAALGSTEEGKLALVNAMPVAVKDKVIAEIKAGNPDSVGNLVDWFGEGNAPSPEATAALSSDDRIAQVISNPDLGWNVKSKVILEIQAGNKDSNENLVDWFNEGKPESEAAASLGSTEEGKLALVNAMPVAVKDKVIAEIKAGNPDSVGNLVDWFGNGNPPSSEGERKAWGGTGNSSDNTPAVPAVPATPAQGGSDDNASAIPATPATPAQPAHNSRIDEVINNPAVGWNVKSKVILEIQAGNQDSNENLIDWFNQGKPASAAAASLGSTEQGKIDLVNTLPVAVKSQVITEIKAGNQDSVGNLVDWFGGGNAPSAAAVSFNALNGGIASDSGTGAMPAAVPTQTYGS